MMIGSAVVVRILWFTVYGSDDVVMGWWYWV